MGTSEMERTRLSPWYLARGPGQAAWIRSDRPLSKALTTAGVRWSHSDGPTATAIEPGCGRRGRLAGQIRRQLKGNPGARPWVVAHGHGGNIALRAVRYLRDSCRRIFTIY
jgi:hypothetical protein